MTAATGTSRGRAPISGWALGALLAVLSVSVVGCATPAPEKQAWDAPRPPVAQGAPDAGALPPEVERQLAGLNGKCARGGMGSCIEIGRLFERGDEGIPRLPARAAEAYGIACKKLESEGCQRLEALLGADDTTPPDLASVMGVFRAACGKRQHEACAGMATLHAYGFGVPESAAKAAEVLEGACAGGGASACLRLGQVKRLGLDANPDPEEAARLERQACVLGLQAACVTVGARVLEMTDGRRRNYWGGESATDRALDAFRAACSKGENAGCVEYAGVLVEGRGVPKDVEAGQSLLRSSCGDGYGRACLALGDLARGPKEERAGLAGALAWWKRGCQHRSGDACSRAGEALLRLGSPGGEPPPRADADAGRALLEKGCTLHAPDACRLLAQLLQRGKPGSAEQARAADYSERACRWGAAEGCPTVRAGRALRGFW